MSVPVRLRAALLTLAACLGLLTALSALAAPAHAAGTPDLTGAINSPTILHGERVPVSISTTNPSGQPYGYNVSFRVVLPAGVSYAGGAPTAPTTIAGPGAGETTLIFRNVADISPNATQALDFEATYDTSRYDVGSRFTITAQAFANDNPRWVPRFDAAGLPIGPAADSYTGSTAVLNGVTTINAIDIEKDEPSWEGEILRGVHDHQTTYTLTVRNNGIRRTDGITVVDYLPARLEFLGCAANPDNTTNAPTNPGTRVEYPGAGPIVVGAVSDCLTPSRVETVNVDPDGAGPLPTAVYTRVTWSLGTLAATTTTRISYRAAIPIRENTMTWSGGAAPALTGAQAVNLDNNNGPETRDEQELTNYATAGGDYNGTLAVRDEDWLTRTAEDWVVHKESDTPDLVQGALTTWTLTFQTSEYRSVRDAVVTDTVPSGLCPVGAANYTTGNSSAAGDNDNECDPNGATPTQPYSGRPVENADGTFTVRWDKSTFPQLAQTNVSQTFTVRFPTITRTRYQLNFNGTTPILTRDAITNRVSTDADQIVRCIAPGTPDCTTVGPEINHDAGYGTGLSIPDASQADEQAARPEIRKRVAQSGSNCTTATYVTTVPTYHPGDRVCWLLHVTFPTGVDTNPQVISDFLPAGTRYELGSDTAYDPPTGANTVAATIDESTAADGVLNWTITGRTVPRGSLVFERTISTIVGPSGTTAQNGEVLGNLMKFSARNTAGISEPLRDQRDIVVETPVLELLKGIGSIDRAGTNVFTASGPNVDGRTVQAGDRVTYRVDVRNSGGQDAESGEVWDLLPSDYDCLFVSGISNGGTCIDGGLQNDRIVWTGLALAAGADLTLRYTTIVPADVGPNRRINNTAGVRTYVGRTNLNTDYPYFPTSNIDPDVTTARINAPAARDPSWVITNPALVAKSGTTEVTEGGNSATQASIGERIDYEVRVTVPAGTTLAEDGLLADVVDSTTRQTYVAGSASLSYSATAPTTVVLDASGTTPRLTFPNGYAVAPNGADGVVTLRFSMLVADVAGNTRVSGDLTNRATLTWRDPEEGAKSAGSATVRTQIVEPLIGQTKTDDRSPDRVIPGEIVEYTLTTTNRSAPGRVSTAHQLVTVDRVPVGVTPIGAAPGNVPLANGATTADGGVWNQAARTITWRAASLAPDATLVRRYRVSVDDPAIGGAVLRNTVDTTAESLDSAGHPGRRTSGTGYAANADDTLQIQGASVTKSVTPDRATIGEPLVYSLTVSIPANVALYDITVTDLLPRNIAFDGYDGATCVSGCPFFNPVQTYDPVRNGDGTTTSAWSLGDLTAPLATPQVLRLSYRAHVLDSVGGVDVVAGDTGVNSVTIGSNRSDRGPFDRTTIPSRLEDESDPERATVTVIEPDVSLDKRVSVSGGAFGDGPATAQSDDTLEYELVVRNDGDAPAYDLTVEDTPDAELTGIVLGTPTGGSASIAGGRISWQIDGPLAVGASVRLRYTARLIAASGLSDGQAIDNTARVSRYWGLPSSRRTEPGVDYREYVGNDDSTSVVLDFPTLTLDKTTGLSGFPDRGRAQVGQAFPWRVTVRNTSATATASNVVVTDTLPENWDYTAGSATLTPGGAVEPTVTANAAGDRLAWTVATLAPGASVTIAYSARPTADAATSPGLGVDANVNSALVSSARDEAGNSGNADGPYGTPADTAAATLLIPALTIAKTPDGGTATAGGTASFTVLVRNTGAVTASNLVIEDTLPRGLSYRAGDATAAPSTGFAERSASGSTIVWTVASLAAGADVAITVPVSVAADVLDGTTLRNVASVRSDEQPDPIDDDGTLDVEARADVAVDKTGATTYVPGEPYSWTIRVSNNGPSDAQNVVLSDPLPSGVTYVRDDAGCTVAAGVVRCALGTLAAGASRTIVLTVRTDPALTGRLTNTATVSTDTPDVDPSNDSDPWEATEDPIADVTVEKTVSVPAVARGGTATFRLVTRNLGPSVARAVRLSDRLPAGLTFVSLDSADCSEAAGTIDCAFGDLAVGAAVTVVVVVRGDAVGSHTNRAEVTTTTPEPPGGGEPNSDEATLEVGPVTDLSIVKSGPAKVAAGGRITWQLTVRNDGPDDATGVVVTDRLPGGVVDATAPAGCTVADGVVRCAIGALANGDAVELELSATAPVSLGSATLVNTASVAGDQIEPDLSDNESEATTIVGPATDLAIVKQGPATVAADGTIAWTLIATNNGPSTATGVVVTDALPGGVVFGGATASQGGCSLSGAVLTCAVGTLAPGASAQITVTASVPAALEGAQLVNVATVGGVEPDPVPSNNRSEVPTRVGPPEAGNYDLAIDKQLAPGARAVLGGSFAYTLRVTNSGPATATGVTVVDTLPNALKGRAASVAGGGSCTIRGQVVSCALGSLAAGASRVVTVRVTAVRAGSVRNAAVVSAAVADRDPANDRDAVTVRVSSPRATLKLTKRALGRQPVARGGNVRFRATVTNASGVAASDVVVCDALPAGLTLRTTGGGRLRGGRLCWQVGLLPARGSRTFTFTARVLGDARGTRITNVATASARNAASVRARATIRLGGSGGVQPGFGRGGGVTG